MVETGYENLLLVRLLLETKMPSIRKSSVSVNASSLCIVDEEFIDDWLCLFIFKVAEGLTVDGILESWGKIKPVIMEAWDEGDKDALIDLFGKVRDDWINNDLTTWIGANRFIYVFKIKSYKSYSQSSIFCRVLSFISLIHSLTKFADSIQEFQMH